MPILFLLFVVVPIIEISVLVHVGGVIGGLNTIALVLVTAAFGAYFVKREGLSTLQSAQQKMNQQQLPAKELVAGACLLVSGVLLITPGFITDIIGFLLLIPYTRAVFAKQVSKHLSMRFAQHSQFSEHGNHTAGDVFEGEYRTQSENDASALSNHKNTNNEKNL